MVKISKRGTIGGFIAMEVLSKANEMQRKGEKVHRFEIGLPSAKAPKKVLDTAKEYIDNTKITYTSPAGMPDLRQAIAKHYKEDYNINVNPDAIFVTSGSSIAFVFAFLAFFEAGDRVAMAFPCYVSYKHCLKALGVEIVPLMSTQQDKYQVTIPLLEQARKQNKIDGLIITSPNNPTGTILNNDELKEILQYCQKHNIRVISDEIYHSIEFTKEKQMTALKFNKDAVIMNGFSKFFCMSGWRLGWVVVPDNAINVMNNLVSNMLICSPAISQYAGIKAFECKDELNKNVKMYKKNLDLVVTELTDMGITEFSYPQGGFYLYADISHLTNDSLEWCNRLLIEEKVAICPGVDFDEYRGNTKIRIVYAGTYEEIKAGLKTLKKFVKKQDIKLIRKL